MADAEVFVDDQPCMETTYVSATEVKCKVPSLDAAARELKVWVPNGGNSAASTLTYRLSLTSITAGTLASSSSSVKSKRSVDSSGNNFKH